jgi:hypothetical protein
LQLIAAVWIAIFYEGRVEYIAYILFGMTMLYIAYQVVRKGFKGAG